ncbi:Clavesin-2, partial [Stegodyphus mimosarum]
MDFLPLSLQHLTQEMEEKAYTELGETPQTKKKALEELKKLILRYRNFETSTLEELAATIMMMGLMLIHTEVSQVCGFVMIWDWKNFSFEDFNKVSFYRAAHYAYDILGCTPFRLRSIHVVNAPSFFNIFYNIIKVLFPKKIISRVFVHRSDLTELHKHVPPELLPEELGGTLGPLNNQEYIEHFLNQADCIEKLVNSGIK